MLFKCLSIMYGKTLEFQGQHKQLKDKYSIGKSFFFSSFFAVNLQLKLFPLTITNADIGKLKYLHTLFDQRLHNMILKFERNCMVRTTRNMFFDKTEILKPVLTKR